MRNKTKSKIKAGNPKLKRKITKLTKSVSLGFFLKSFSEPELKKQADPL